MRATDFLSDTVDPVTPLSIEIEAARAARELLVQPNGQARQAGATQPEGDQVTKWRIQAERSLYFLARGILKCWWLTPALHKPICQWLQRVPPRRKMLMIPRAHGKTTVAGQCLPIHLWIQPAASNIYMPGLPGTHFRILMVGEKEQRASDHMRVVQHHIMSNELLRALWPHVVWQNPKREARKWSDTEMNVRRDQEFPDPSMRAIGSSGAITGAHPNVMIEDDLTTEEAANSPVVMQTAIESYKNRTALLDPITGLRFITCTRWVVGDLPEYIMEQDATVEVNSLWRSIYTPDGNLIYPAEDTPTGRRGFTTEAVDDLRKTFGPRFWLLYMNTVGNSSLTDFNEDDLRFYRRESGMFVFDEDERDEQLAVAMNAPRPNSFDERGMRLTDAIERDSLRKRAMRVRYA